MQRQKQEQRKQQFKKGLDADDARRKREDGLNEIRKQKQLDQLDKRRHRDGAFDPNSGVDAQFTATLDALPQMVAGVMSNDPAEQLNSTMHFRRMLSIESNPPIQAVINAGVVPRFRDFLQSSSPKLQFEAAWTLTNIASGTSAETRAVVESGAVPIFVQLLRSQHDQVREQAIWALGNIAGDSPQWRDYVLSFDAMSLLLDNFTDLSRESLVRNAIWTLSNFCRGKPPPNFSTVSPALPVLAYMIRSEDPEVLADACWALSYLSDGPNEKIQAVIDARVCPRLVELLRHQAFTVQTPALRCIGNIVTGDDAQTQHIIDLGALSALAELLDSSKRAIRKETCWTLSNITAGNDRQIQAVIDSGMIPHLIIMLSNAATEIKKEVCWALSNATSGGNARQIQYLVDCGLIPPLCEMLSANEPKIVTVALEGLENILRAGTRIEADVNPYAVLVYEAEGVTKLESMHGHRNHEIYSRAMSIIHEFFEGDDEPETLAPTVDNTGNLQFGLPQGAPKGGFGGF